MTGACGVSMRRARRGRPARRCAWLPAAFVALCSQEGRAQSEADGPLTVEGELDEVGKPPGQDLLYRAARELLTNAVQHAHARTARVTLHRVGDAVELTVSDDGVGFDPDVLASGVTEGRIGLASLITRVEAMGGELELTTAPGLGTRARVSIPRSAE